MKVPTGVGTSQIEIKKSRFIGHARYFGKPDHLKLKLLEHRGKYADCSHVAYAYISGLGGDVFGMSDDREPKGTAGRPILEVVRGSGITNVIVFVVRYFGGTKLGTGGLARAYSEAAKTAIANLPVEVHIPRLQFQISVPYAYYQPTTCLVESMAGSITRESFDEMVTIEGLIPEEASKGFSAGMADLSNGKLAPSYGDQPGSSET